jgi:hypothetical protein
MMLLSKPTKSSFTKISMPVPAKTDLSTPHKVVIKSKS